MIAFHENKSIRLKKNRIDVFWISLNFFSFIFLNWEFQSIIRKVFQNVSFTSTLPFYLIITVLFSLIFALFQSLYINKIYKQKKRKWFLKTFSAFFSQYSINLILLLLLSYITSEKIVTILGLTNFRLCSLLGIQFLAKPDSLLQFIGFCLLSLIYGYITYSLMINIQLSEIKHRSKIKTILLLTLVFMINSIILTFVLDNLLGIIVASFTSSLSYSTLLVWIIRASNRNNISSVREPINRW